MDYGDLGSLGRGFLRAGLFMSGRRGLLAHLAYLLLEGRRSGTIGTIRELSRAFRSYAERSFDPVEEIYRSSRRTLFDPLSRGEGGDINEREMRDQIRKFERAFSQIQDLSEAAGTISQVVQAFISMNSMLEDFSQAVGPINREGKERLNQINRHLRDIQAAMRSLGMGDLAGDIDEISYTDQGGAPRDIYEVLGDVGTRSQKLEEVFGALQRRRRGAARVISEQYTGQEIRSLFDAMMVGTLRDPATIDAISRALGGEDIVRGSQAERVRQVIEEIPELREYFSARQIVERQQQAVISGRMSPEEAAAVGMAGIKASMGRASPEEYALAMRGMPEEMKRIFKDALREHYVENQKNLAEEQIRFQQEIKENTERFAEELREISERDPSEIAERLSELREKGLVSREALEQYIKQIIDSPEMFRRGELPELLGHLLALSSMEEGGRINVPGVGPVSLGTGEGTAYTTTAREDLRRLMEDYRQGRVDPTNLGGLASAYPALAATLGRTASVAGVYVHGLLSTAGGIIPVQSGPQMPRILESIQEGAIPLSLAAGGGALGALIGGPAGFALGSGLGYLVGEMGGNVMAPISRDYMQFAGRQIGYEQITGQDTSLGASGYIERTVPWLPMGWTQDAMGMMLNHPFISTILNLTPAGDEIRGMIEGAIGTPDAAAQLEKTIRETQIEHPFIPVEQVREVTETMLMWGNSLEETNEKLKPLVDLMSEFRLSPEFVGFLGGMSEIAGDNYTQFAARQVRAFSGRGALPQAYTEQTWRSISEEMMRTWGPQEAASIASIATGTVAALPEGQREYAMQLGTPQSLAQAVNQAVSNPAFLMMSGIDPNRETLEDPQTSAKVATGLISMAREAMSRFGAKPGQPMTIAQQNMLQNFAQTMPGLQGLSAAQIEQIAMMDPSNVQQALRTTKRNQRGTNFGLGGVRGEPTEGGARAPRSRIERIRREALMLGESDLSLATRTAVSGFFGKADAILSPFGDERSRGAFAETVGEIISRERLEKATPETRAGLGGLVYLQRHFDKGKGAGNIRVAGTDKRLRDLSEEEMMKVARGETKLLVDGQQLTVEELAIAHRLGKVERGKGGRLQLEKGALRDIRTKGYLDDSIGIEKEGRGEKGKEKGAGAPQKHIIDLSEEAKRWFKVVDPKDDNSAAGAVNRAMERWNQNKRGGRLSDGYIHGQ